LQRAVCALPVVATPLRVVTEDLANCAGLSSPQAVVQAGLVLSDTSGVTVTNTSAGAWTISPEVSTTAGNILTVDATGLFVPAPGAGFVTGVADTATVSHLVTAGVLSSTVKLSTTANNILNTDGTGLYLSICQIGAAAAATAVQSLPAKVMGIDVGNCPVILAPNQFQSVFGGASGTIKQDARYYFDDVTGSFAAAGFSPTTTGIRSAVVGGESGLALAMNAFVAGGNTNSAQALNSISLGGQFNASFVEGAACIGGRDNTNRGLNSLIGAGRLNTNEQENSLVSGRSNTLFGTANSASFVSGENNTSIANVSGMIGQQLRNYSVGGVVIGHNNIDNGIGNPTSYVSTDHIFVVGIGTLSTNRQNGFAVRKDSVIQKYIVLNAGVPLPAFPDNAAAIAQLNLLGTTNLFFGAEAMLNVAGTPRTFKYDGTAWSLAY
jgi:hypothetical protein